MMASTPGNSTIVNGDSDLVMDDSNSTLDNNISSTYYAVFVPSGPENQSSSEENGPTGAVFDQKDLALSAARKAKSRGARFKQFERQESAEMFAKYGNISISPESKRRRILTRSMANSVAEDGGTADLAAPTKPQLSDLKRKIEQGLTGEVESMVRENPRLLINISSDTPTVIHTGCHYNALHIAARSGHADIVKLVLQLISDANYLSTLYIKESDSISKAEQRLLEQKRREKLLDLYLNTPEKGMGDTPLHIASKTGLVDVVKELTVYGECNKSATNKQGKTPAEIACSRCDTEHDKMKLKLDVLQHLNPVYVPLYRSDCSSKVMPPVDGYPKYRIDHMSPMLVRSPVLASELVLSGMAGPTNMQMAEKLYQHWSSGRSSTQIDRSVKRSDPHKGMERIGRRLAASMNIQWTEYWPFLETFADLREESGWQLLETYLQNKMSSLKEDFGEDLQRRLTFDDAEIEKPSGMSERASLLAPAPSPLSQLCTKFTNLQLKSPIPTIHLERPLSDKSENNKENIAAGTEGDCFEDAVETGLNLSVDEDEQAQQFYTPPSTPPGAYLGAVGPSKVDLDVLNAIQEGQVPDEGLARMGYPLLAGWISRINFFSDKDRRQWPALDSPRAKNITKKAKRRVLQL